MSSTDSSAGADNQILTGLTAEQVRASRAQNGANLLTPPARDPWWRLYLEKFKDPIIKILIIAAVVALLVGLYDGHYIEGIGIVVAILLATGLSFINEYRAGKEFDLLNQVADDDPVTVIRDGSHHTVPKRDLVVGDIALVERGAEIPADGEVVEAVALEINESSLTGESVPVEKKPRDADAADAAAASAEAAGSGAAYEKHRALRGTTVSEW
ncbi:MAG: haloacid dehalogenase, partial [Planctomycetes bacterium]|nr:haloacid dehalogenase [Planctomycetota bacterium]